MTKSIWQANITDRAGNIISGAAVEVRNESDSELAIICRTMAKMETMTQ